jgi:DNA helicase IV
MSKQSELELEQAHVDRAYARLGDLRSRVEFWREQMLQQGGAGTFSNRFERDRLVDAYTARIGEFEFGDEALCFGRLDLDDGSTFHLGRLSVADEGGDPLVVDWRAPAAAVFYRATPLAPLGVVRRRHLLCRGRQVVTLDDDLLELEPGAATDGLELVGEAALLEALRRTRTGRMRDIVATIQSDQDRAVRAPLAGALVIEGGPGTGKTAVALHRAAYLLYAERVLLEEQGILVIGPTPTFCRYVSQVLPSLGEEGVVLATIAAWSTTRSRSPGSRATSEWLRSSPPPSALASAACGKPWRSRTGRTSSGSLLRTRSASSVRCALAAVITTTAGRSSSGSWSPRCGGTSGRRGAAPLDAASVSTRAWSTSSSKLSSTSSV